jgi:hypothetical protein
MRRGSFIFVRMRFGIACLLAVGCSSDNASPSPDLSAPTDLSASTDLAYDDLLVWNPGGCAPADMACPASCAPGYVAVAWCDGAGGGCACEVSPCADAGALSCGCAQSLCLGHGVGCCSEAGDALVCVPCG